MPHVEVSDKKSTRKVSKISMTKPMYTDALCAKNDESGMKKGTR